MKNYSNATQDVFTVAEWFAAFAEGAPVTLAYYDKTQGAFFGVGNYDGRGNCDKFAACYVGDWVEDCGDNGETILYICDR